MFQLDHWPSRGILEEGAACVATALGMTPGPGREHDHMSTHIISAERQGRRRYCRHLGGIPQQQDYDFLKKSGVKAIFGPGTNIPEAAKEILTLIRTARQ